MSPNSKPAPISSESTPVTLQAYQSYITVLADTYNHDGSPTDSQKKFYSSALIPFYFEFEGGEELVTLTGEATFTLPGAASSPSRERIALILLETNEFKKVEQFSQLQSLAELHAPGGQASFKVEVESASTSPVGEKDTHLHKDTDLKLKLTLTTTATAAPFEGGICIVLETQDPHPTNVEWHRPTMDWKTLNGQSLLTIANSCKLYTFHTLIWPGDVKPLIGGH